MWVWHYIADSECSLAISLRVPTRHILPYIKNLGPARCRKLIFLEAIDPRPYPTSLRVWNRFAVYLKQRSTTTLQKTVKNSPENGIFGVFFSVSALDISSRYALKLLRQGNPIYILHEMTRHNFVSRSLRTARSARGEYRCRRG